MSRHRKFLVKRVYAAHDYNYEGDVLWIELIDKQTGTVVMEGDHSRDTIYAQISGFFKALDYAKVRYFVWYVQRREGKESEEDM